MHEIYLDEMEIPNAEAVETTSDRDVKEYSGVGAGVFAVAKEKQLRAWSIKLETGDSELLAFLEERLESREPCRLVIYSPGEGISVLALLYAVAKSEKFAGVYSVTVKLREYKPVGVKTTDVPYVARPGKAPEPPKTVVFNGGSSTPYKALTNGTPSHETANDPRTIQNKARLEAIWESEGKSYTNPCLVPKGKPVKVSFVEAVGDIVQNPAEYLSRAAGPKVTSEGVRWDVSEQLRQEKARKARMSFLDAMDESLKGIRSNGGGGSW